MAVQKIPSTSVNGPDGATRLVFGGYSSTGTYIYSSPLPAGNYIAQIRYTTSRDISNTTSTRWFPQFTLSGSVNGSLLSSMSPAGFSYESSSTSYVDTRDGNYYFNLAQTESALTIAGGYTVTLGTTVTTWTTSGGNIDFMAMPKPDVTSLAMTTRGKYILGLTDKGINTYHFPTGVAITHDNGVNWNQTSTGSSYQYYDLFPLTNSLAQGYQNAARWATQLFDNRNVGNQIHISKNRYLTPVGIDDQTQYKTMSMKNIGIYDVSGLTFSTNGGSNNIYNITGGNNGARYLAVGQYTATTGIPYLASSNDGIGWVSRGSTTNALSMPAGSTLASAVISAVVSNEQRHIITSSHSTTAVQIVFSTNLSTFTTRTNPTSATIFTYGTFVDSRFYLIGNSDRIAISTDGLTWTSSGIMPSNHKYTMAYSSTPTNKYVIGMDSGVIATSTDGNTWTSRTSNMSSRITGVAWGAGVYVAGGFGAHLRYSTDGVTWATSSTNYTATSRSIVGVGYGPDGFLAAVIDNTTNPTYYFQSTDGITWASTRSYDYYYQASYSAWHSNRETRASGYYGNSYYFSTPTYNAFFRELSDSLQQTSNANYTTNSWYTTSPTRYDSNAPIGVTYFPNMTAGGNYLMWGQINYGGNGNATSGQTYNGQMMQSYSWNTPSNAISILNTPSGDVPTVRDVAYSAQAGYAIAVGDFGRIAKATTGNSWTQVTTSQFGFDDIHCVTYADGIWLAGGDNGKMSRSTDGTTWSTVTSGFGTSTIWALSHNSQVFIAAGGGGYLATSTDGNTWTQRTSNMGGKDIYVITPSVYLTDFVPESWFIAGQDSAGAISTDGITWTTRNVVPPSIVEVQDVVKTATNYVGLVGYTKSITNGGVWYPIRSTDGLTWTVPTLRATTTSYWSPTDSSYSSDGLSQLVYATGGNLFAVDTGGNGSSRNSSQGAYSRYSTDGVTWDVVEITPLANSTRAQRVQMVSSQYIAWTTVGGGPALIARSPYSGVSWSTVANPFTSSVNPWYWGAGNGFYLVSGGVTGKLYKTTNFSSYSLIIFGGSSNSVMLYDSTNSRWVLVDASGKSFYSADALTWTQGQNISVSSPNKIELDGVTGNYFVSGANSYAYGNPLTGWSSSSFSPAGAVASYWTLYDSTTEVVTVKNRATAIQYGTLVSGSSTSGTISPAYISLYATNLINL